MSKRSESVYQRMTDTTKKDKQTMIYKALHLKLKPSNKNPLNTGMVAVPDPVMTPVVVIWVETR